MSGIIRHISDLHLLHPAMALHRGFKGVDEHDEFIIDRWNSVVNKRDVTWVHGDLSMERLDLSILSRLNGKIRAILGNHERVNMNSNIHEYVISMHSLVKIKHKKYGRIWLSHCPVHPIELDTRVEMNIHGHIHEKYKIDDERYINVCVEVQDYTPKTLDQLIGGLL